MAREVTMYMACDKTVFETKGECIAYERELNDVERVNEFLKSDLNIYDKSAHMTVAETTLLAYCAYLRGDQPTVKEETTDGADSN